MNTARYSKSGLSAYELAVENGFEGTVVEWLVSLNGNQSGIAGEAVNVAVDDTNLPYTANTVQEALEEEQIKIIYGGNY